MVSDCDLRLLFCPFKSLNADVLVWQAAEDSTSVLRSRQFPQLRGQETTGTPESQIGQDAKRWRIEIYFLFVLDCSQIQSIRKKQNSITSHFLLLVTARNSALHQALWPGRILSSIRVLWAKRWESFDGPLSKSNIFLLNTYFKC